MRYIMKVFFRSFWLRRNGLSLDSPVFTGVFDRKMIPLNQYVISKPFEELVLAGSPPIQTKDISIADASIWI